MPYSGSGSNSQRYESADPEPHPDPYKNFMDAQHWKKDFQKYLDLRLDVLDGVGGLHLQGDRLPSEGLDENLHASPQPQHQVESRFLLDVVIRESPAILQLLASEDQPLLVGRNPLLILHKLMFLLATH
jgi:hypothetical protein